MTRKIAVETKLAQKNLVKPSKQLLTAEVSLASHWAP